MGYSATARAAVGTATALFVATLWLLARGVGGAFLSDDFGHLHAIFAAADRGELGAWTLARFFEPLDNGNFAYRPIALASYVADWLLYGANATGWHITNLLLYGADALVAGWLVTGWLRPRAPYPLVGGAVAACALVVFPLAGEIAFWPVGRFDLLAVLFSLLCLATLTPRHTATALSLQVWRVLLLLAALLSKESAMPLPAVVSLVSWGLAAGTQPGCSTSERWRAVVRTTWPVWLAFAAYLAWRYALFGSPWKVYPASVAPTSLDELLARVAPITSIVKGNVGPRYLLWSGAAIVLLGASLTPWARGRDPETRPPAALIVALAASAGLYVVAPWVSLAAAPPWGEGSRHLFMAWVYIALLLGAAVAWRPWQWMPAMLFALLMLVGQTQGIRQWHAAGQEMKAIVAAIDEFAGRVAADEYALLLLPDHIGVALFARNGQGGIVTRPVQRRDYLDRVAPMVSAAFEHWSANLTTRGTVAQLKGRPFDTQRFVGLFCWNPLRQAIVPLTGGALAPDPQAWQREAEANFASAGCLAPF